MEKTEEIKSGQTKIDSFAKSTTKKVEKITTPKKSKIVEEKVTTEIVDQPKNNSSKFYNSVSEFRAALSTWSSILSEYTESKKFEKIFDYVKGEYQKTTCYPPFEQIFNAFALTKLDDIKVVVIGQDPYFNEGEAMGLCFSVNRGIKVPPSLGNIYTGLIEEGFLTSKLKHGDLSSWASQGVLMLNATLTVQAKKANSHQKMSNWEDFTDFVIKTVDAKCKGVVFLLWGGFAHKKKGLIKNSHVIENVHPSPLAAASGKGKFSDLKQFTKVNEYLLKEGKEVINWGSIKN